MEALKTNKLELWESALYRYEKIYDITKKVANSLFSDGSCELDIASCGFCGVFYDIDCEGCPWGEKFGKCEEEASKWLKLNDNYTKILLCLVGIIYDIKDEINKIKSGDNG